MSFKTGKFPGKMKLAKIIPIFRKGEKMMYLTIALFLYYLKCQKYYKNYFRRGY